MLQVWINTVDVARSTDSHIDQQNIQVYDHKLIIVIVIEKVFWVYKLCCYRVV